MKYTDEEIIKKFSNVDYDKAGYKQQAIFAKVSQNVAARRTNSMKKYKIIAAAAVIVLIAVPAALLISKAKYQDMFVGEAQLEKAEKPSTAVPTKIQESVEHFNANEKESVTVSSMSDSLALTNLSAPTENQKAASPVTIKPLKSVVKYSHRGRLGAASMSSASFDSAATWSSATESRAGAYVARTAVVHWEEPEMPISQDTKEYNENGFKKAVLEPLSTFSADVDTASSNKLK